MTFEYIQFAFNVLQFLLISGIGFYVYMSNKDRVTNDRVSAIETDVKAMLNTHTEQIARLETQAEHAPKHEDLAMIHDKINQVSDCVSRLEGEFGAASKTLDLIHDFLMRGSK